MVKIVAVVIVDLRAQATRPNEWINVIILKPEIDARYGLKAEVAPDDTLIRDRIIRPSYPDRSDKRTLSSWDAVRQTISAGWKISLPCSSI